MRIVFITSWCLIIACATVKPAPTSTTRELLSRALGAFVAAAGPTASPSLWLTNEDDTDCDRAESALHGQAVAHPLDAVAYEVFENQLTATRWAHVVEAHRHNYARDLKPETRKNVVTKEGSTVVEDLCFLDEAKKRNVDKVLVYQVVGEAPGSVMVHFRLSDARTGLIEVSRTFLAGDGAVEDRSAK